jgi:hypothetical protein
VTESVRAIPAFERPSAISSEHLAFARGEVLERIVDAPGSDKLLHEGGVDDRGAFDDSVERARNNGGCPEVRVCVRPMHRLPLAVVTHA